MAWNDDPQVRSLANWTKRFGYVRVVAVVFTKDDRCGYVSYGRDAQLCKSAEKIGDQIYQEIQNGNIEVA